MIKEIKISEYQLAMLMMGFLFGSTAIINPASTAGQDAWLVFLLGWAEGFFLMWLYVTISLSYPGLTLVDILKATFGKYVGSILALFYIWYFIHLAAVVFRNFGEHMVITVYYNTPMVFLIGCFALLVSYCLRKGLEVTGRAAEMLMPYLIIILTVIFCILIPEYDVNRFFPFLEKGFASIAIDSVRVLTFPFGEAVAFLMIFPTLNSAQKLKKASFLSVFTMGLIILGVILRDIMSLGPDMLMRSVFPPSLSSELTKGVQLDPLVAVNLLLGGWIKITVLLYGAVVGITQLLNLNDYRPFVLPVAMLCAALAVWIYKDIFEMFDWAQIFFPVYVTPMQIVIPVMILVITKLKQLLKNK